MQFSHLSPNLVDKPHDCDELPSLKRGNNTMWGCQASNSKSDWAKNGTWWNQCCTWKDETCVEIDKGSDFSLICMFQTY